MKKLFWHIRYGLHKLRIRWIYRGDTIIPWYVLDEQNKCPCCGWDPEVIDFDPYCDSYLGSSNMRFGYDGGRYWTDHWECPRCNTLFSVEASD